MTTGKYIFCPSICVLPKQEGGTEGRSHNSEALCNIDHNSSKKKTAKIIMVRGDSKMN